MALPVNIEDLLHGNTIEWERLEFKQGWNPEDVLHSMCAFANDFHNWGGGYIIVGIAEENGQPLFPPAGLQQNQLDAIQGQIIQLGHKIQPNYFPITQPYILQNQHILVLWCPAGDNRPYSAPSTLGNGAQRQHYIRVGSHSIITHGDNLRRLQELAARVPFDDRVNNQATIQDFDLGLIQAHLQEIKSDLYAASTGMALEELCRTMLIVKGPFEDLRPVNVGLLFFTKEPERFFARTWIELVWHQDGSGRKFKEYYFRGPLQKQLRDTLSFLKTNIISEQIIKHADKAESDRYYNFPYDAVEEVLSNAVYHKSYELGSPIEIQVWPDKIEFLSHPGPVPPVNAEILSTYKRIVAREYRNRRIGDILKELRLTEGRGTGFPTIYRAMESNGSPSPAFETDELTFVLVTLPIHSLSLVNDQVSDQDVTLANIYNFNTLEAIIAYSNQSIAQAIAQANAQASAQANAQANALTKTLISAQAIAQARIILNDQVNSRVSDVLFVVENWIKRADIFARIDLSNHSKNRLKYLDPLIDLGWIEMEYPDKKTTPKQRYKITKSGERILNLITKNDTTI
jgi:ATP-dependent DNA helicase RecG